MPAQQQANSCRKTLFLSQNNQGMTTVATATVSTEIRKNKRAPRVLTLEQFRRRYSNREDGYKYEFNNGIIEKSLSLMTVRQFHIVDNLIENFRETVAFKSGGRLASKIEQITSNSQLRRPDLAYLTRSKIQTEDESASEFVIKIISPTDNYLKVKKKLREYFKAGVRVVWQIIPEEQSAHVFTSPTQVTICEGETLCSAAPVVPDFQIAAKDIFVK
jgi:Uma2 family endonuclease